jgi:hypothetical protein
MLVRFDKGELQDVFRDIRTPRHAEGVSVQRIAVTTDQQAKRIAVSTQDALDDQLISILPLIGRARIGLRHLHDGRILPFPRVGQGS